MKFSQQFFKIVVLRDFNPIQGNKSDAQHFFQCKLPIWGSWIILFILCLIGIISLGIHGGIKSHLEHLENNPFASAIRIEGTFTRDRLQTLKEKLLFHLPSNELVTNKTESEESIPIIHGVYPFNLISIRFLNQYGDIVLKSTHDVLSVKVQKNNNSQHDDYVQKWVSKNLKYNHFFKQNDQIKDGIIVSETLMEKIGLDCSNKDLMMSHKISFLSVSGKSNLLEERAKANKDLWAPLTQDEKNRFTVEFPLIDIATHLPGGDAIITENLYQCLSSGTQYDPCRSVEYFYLNFSNGYDLPVKEKVLAWAKDNFGNQFLRQPYFSPDQKIIKFQFTDILFNKQYLEKTAKCFIKNQVINLEKQIEMPINLDFKDEGAECSGGSDTYYYAFLYISKHPAILDNVKKLTHFLKNEFGSYIEDHQVMTLIKYRKDMDRVNWILLGVFISIAILMLIYIIVTFSLFLQMKIHNIGMMMSFGASSYLITQIYLFEAFKLIIFPLSMSLMTGLFIAVIGSCATDFLYYLDIVYLLLFAFSVIFIALAGAWLAAKHIVSQSPFRLISYKA